MIRIPKRFYDDHCERDLDAPEILKETKAHYYISDEPCAALDELVDDAKFYFGEWFHGGAAHCPKGIMLSAKATLEAMGYDLEKCL